MKVVCSGMDYRVFKDDVCTYDELPAGYYHVVKTQTGFFLTKQNNFEKEDRKLYGDIESKINKVVRSYEISNKNLGVILSGVKGIGKSLFARNLSIAMYEKGLPIIIIDKYYDGLIEFLSDIDQRCVILFDEFDKVFKVKYDDSNTNKDPQTYMLSLFDGVYPGKKLFVITCNDIDNVNEYIVNRPGRFHYHFIFNYPSIEDSKAYILDNVPDIDDKNLKDILDFCNLVPLNYDCLEAICFELRLGNDFKESINDLNIIKSDDIYKYYPTLYFKDGSTIKLKKITVNIFERNEFYGVVYILGNNNCDYCGRLRFDSSNSEFVDGRIIITKGVELKFDPDDLDDPKYVELSKRVITKLELVPYRLSVSLMNRFFV